jgi:hypothetical protein
MGMDVLRRVIVVSFERDAAAQHVATTRIVSVVRVVAAVTEMHAVVNNPPRRKIRQKLEQSSDDALRRRRKGRQGSIIELITTNKLAPSSSLSDEYPP